MQSYDAIVIGAGVIGCSVAYHLVRFGAKRVLVIDRTQIGAGTTSQSSGILRTHYTVAENVELALASWRVFRNFAEYVGDPEASAGLVQCGYLIASPDGPKLSALRHGLDGQRRQGITVDELDARQASELLPIARFDDAALIGYEPDAGFADPYLVASGFAKAARRHGAKILEGVEVQALQHDNGRVVGVETSQGCFASDTVISAQNIWARDIERWTGIASPVSAERHTRARAARSAAVHATDAGLQGSGLRRHVVLPLLWRFADAGERGHRRRDAGGTEQRAGRDLDGLRARRRRAGRRTVSVV